MDFGLSDSQDLLRRTVADFLERHAPVEQVRSIMKSDTGHDSELYLQLADMGATSLLLPEQYGGSELGLLEAAIVAQECGKRVVPFSFHTAAVAAPLLLLQAGSEQQREHWLTRLAEGKVLLTTILDFPGEGEVESEVESEVLNGTVLYVPDAHVANGIIVRASGSLHVVELPHPGVAIELLESIDETRRLTEVTFTGVKLGEATRLTEPADVEQLSMRVEQATQIVLAADSLGACQSALSFAVDYSLGRTQFGRVIGSFQAVKHMCAEVVAAIEPVQSLLWYAAFCWDEQSDETAHLAPLLKAHASEVATEAVTLTTQVMGGIGFTYESDMHLWFKRVGLNRQIHGSPEALRAQAAELQFGGA